MTPEQLIALTREVGVHLFKTLPERRAEGDWTFDANVSIVNSATMEPTVVMEKLAVLQKVANELGIEVWFVDNTQLDKPPGLK